jgi:hypothetical protein
MSTANQIFGNLCTCVEIGDFVLFKNNFNQLKKQDYSLFYIRHLLYLITTHNKKDFIDLILEGDFLDELFEEDCISIIQDCIKNRYFELAKIFLKDKRVEKNLDNIFNNSNIIRKFYEKQMKKETRKYKLLKIN